MTRPRRASMEVIRLGGAPSGAGATESMEGIHSMLPKTNSKRKNRRKADCQGQNSGSAYRRPTHTFPVHDSGSAEFMPLQRESSGRWACFNALLRANDEAA